MLKIISSLRTGYKNTLWYAREAGDWMGIINNQKVTIEQFLRNPNDEHFQSCLIAVAKQIGGTAKNIAPNLACNNELYAKYTQTIKTKLAQLHLEFKAINFNEVSVVLHGLSRDLDLSANNTNNKTAAIPTIDVLYQLKGLVSSAKDSIIISSLQSGPKT